jgi:hypothetical protein
LSEELAATEMQGLDVFANDLGESVVPTDEVLEHEGMPLAEGRGDLIHDGLA